MDRVTLGFIGAGGIARRHLDVLEQFSDVRLAGVADPDPARAEAAARRYGGRAHASLDSLLDAEPLDAVYICVPPFAHGAPERALIARGLPFFVEKPLSLDLDTAAEISRDITASGLVTAVGYHWRYLDTVETAREVLAKNPARLACGYWLDQTPPPAWWGRTDRSGGQIVEQATHVIDLARLLMGEIVAVHGQSAYSDRPDFPDLDVATASTASLRFASGAVGTLAATCLLRWGHRIGLDLFADGLAIEMNEREIMIDVGQGRPVRMAEGDPVARADRDFIDAVLGRGNRPRCSYAEALGTHRVALAIAQSAAIGRPVTLSQAPEPAHV